MQKWEYLVIDQHRKTTVWEPTFDIGKIGRDGWELVSVVPIASDEGEEYAGISSDLKWIFKRPLA